MRLALLLAGLIPAARGGPREDAVVAAMRLSEQPNYAWVTTVVDDARTYDIAGRTNRDGFSRVTMPAVNALRRRLGRSVTDTHVEFIFRGNVDCVVATDAGWRRPDELPAEPPEPGRPPGAGSPGVEPPRPPSRRPDTRAYSNLQPGLSRPHEELGVIVASHATLDIDGETVTGTLTENGARLLLVRDGQDAIAPLRASGTFKLWHRGGIVVRYQLALRGTLQVQVAGGSRLIEVSQSSETWVKEVGTSAFEVPPEALVRLGG